MIIKSWHEPRRVTGRELQDLPVAEDHAKT
jgi:hypothetical protein